MSLSGNASCWQLRSIPKGSPSRPIESRVAEFMQMDAREIPFVDEFDAIGAFDVLEHIDEDETVLEQMFRA